MRNGRDAREEEQRKPSRISLPSVCTLILSAAVRCPHSLLSIGRDGFSEKQACSLRKRGKPLGPNYQSFLAV